VNRGNFGILGEAHGRVQEITSVEKLAAADGSAGARIQSLRKGRRGKPTAKHSKIVRAGFCVFRDFRGQSSVRRSCKPKLLTTDENKMVRPNMCSLNIGG
jgi:hypothetical protein